MPRMAYIKMKRSRSPPMFASECIVITIVLNINRKLLPLLISLRTLRIRKLLRIVMTPRIDNEELADMKMLMKEPRMIMKSNTFHPSLKYKMGPLPIILTTASVMKTAVKM